MIIDQNGAFPHAPFFRHAVNVHLCHVKKKKKKKKAFVASKYFKHTQLINSLWLLAIQILKLTFLILKEHNKIVKQYHGT